MSAGSLRDELRTATQQWHDAVEKTIAILNPAKTREDYVRILQKFYGFYQPIEAANPAYQEGKDRSKLRWLREDLLSLGQSRSDIEALAICREVDVLVLPAQHFGCMYVLEGSTLGGQFVCRHVAERFGITPGNGASFFNSYGERVGPMWREFIAEMEARFHAAADRRIVVHTAVRTFETFHNWLQK